MGFDKTTVRFLRICEIIMRFAYVNLLWIGFTLMGLVIFSFMPATVALFSVVRKWVMGQSEIAVFKTFWKIFRKEFLKSNLLGLILLTFSYILYLDFVFLPTGGIYSFIRALLIVVGLLFVITFIYIFPIYVHFEWKISHYIKYALLIGVAHPHYTLLMGIGLWIIYYLNMSVPGLMPFFSVSMMAYFLMRVSYNLFISLGSSQTDTEKEQILTDSQLIETQ